MADNIVTIEAEDFAKHGFKTVHGNKASGGDLVKITGHKGSLKTDFSGKSGTYDLTVFVQDESDGQSTIEVLVDGKVVGTIDLDGNTNQIGSNNGGFDAFTLTGLDIDASDKIELRAKRDGHEFVRIDRVEFAHVDVPERVTVLHEDFGDKNLAGSSDVELSDFLGAYGGALTNGHEDGALVFRDLDLSHLEDVQLSLDAAILSGHFEEIGSQFGDFLRIEVVTDQGVIVLDTFSGNGQTLIGDKTGQTIDAGLEALNYVLPSGLESAQLRIVSDISAANEKILLDNVKVTAIEALKPVDPDQICIEFDVDANGNALHAGDGLAGGLVLEGVTFTAIRDQDKIANGGNGVFDDVMVFDAANPTGGDTDLFQPAQGNIIIISEDGDASDPDDNARGGTIVAELDTLSTVNSITILDTDTRSGGTVELFGADGALLASFAIPQIADGGLQTLDLGDTENVKRVEVNFKSSGAIDDFKFVPQDAPEPAALGDLVFFDADRDGIQDPGETGVEGVTVTLTGGGLDGVIGTPDDTTETQVTDADGGYLFTGLNPGEEYKVTFSGIPTGLAFTAPNQGGDDALDSDAVVSGPGEAMSQIVTLAPGQTDLDIDAGLVDPGTAALGDTVFFDENGNGLLDQGEGLVEGALVELLDGQGNVLDSQLTGADGGYLFDQLQAGSYQVRFNTVGDFVFTTASSQPAEAANNDSDADQTTGLTDLITLDIGETDLDIDAGLVDPGTAA
ncbi:MAG: SdrD B-like domain-containing protein, partial [Pseudomonadota bacterium]